MAVINQGKTAGFGCLAHGHFEAGMIGEIKVTKAKS
jgi:uncharacterized cupredoxin-like copper-binding protein